jgi:hypothetical protein
VISPSSSVKLLASSQLDPTVCIWPLWITEYGISFVWVILRPSLWSMCTSYSELIVQTTRCAAPCIWN